MSLRSQQAGRDAANYDNDRKDGRYAAGGDRVDWISREPVALEPHKQAAVDEAMAQIERCFGKLPAVQQKAAA